MIETISISGVCERDIDLLLLEEFWSSSNFLQWFVSQVVSPNCIAHNLLEASRSVTQSNGESDLEISFQDSENCEISLLIENKVNASLQPQQAERYTIRGNIYLTQNKCSSFYTIIIAPDRYFNNELDLKGFDKKVSYEVIRDWFINNQDIENRKFYKVALLTAAIEKGTYGYQLLADAPVSDFWHKYWQLAEKIAPELKMEKPGPKPANAGFIYFRPSVLPRKPQRIEIVHKTFRGNVDLQFGGMGEKLDELKTQFKQFTTSGMKFEKANKSGSIRLYVPPVNPAIDFEEQINEVQKGLEGAKLLLDVYMKSKSVK